MSTLGIILARAGSKGLPNKCLRELHGRALIEFTFEHALASRRLSSLVFSTDCEPAKELARESGIEVIDRPAELATDTATVDAAARHAVEVWEERRGARVDAVALLYGNIPIRAAGLIDRAIDQLAQTGADSVRSVAPVGKHHPDWLHRLDGDRMIQFRPNSIYRRQDLEPVYYHDGAVAVVTRQALFDALKTPEDKQSFLGRDRRAIVQRPDDAVDVDEPLDLHIADTVLRARRTPSVEAGSSPHPVRIGGHLISPGQRVLIVAEAGVNHDGSRDKALKLVDAAVEAGADAVKFQLFQADRLVASFAKTAGYQKASGEGESQRAMLERLELSAPDFARIKKHCDERGILFLATPFGEAELDWLMKLGVAAIKIASTDLANVSLLDKAATAAVPLMLSTGASTQQEIVESVERLRRAGAGDRLVLLHCVSCYPTPLEGLNLRAIRSLEERFRVPCGLSDHTTSTATGALGVAAGACVLEKHFTLDRNAKGPDHSMSLTPAELGDYVAAVREADAALGTGVIGLRGIERDVRLAAGKSIVAARPIPTGARFTPEMLTIKRPGTGIPPVELPALLARRAAQEIPFDTVLTWDMVE